MCGHFGATLAKDARTMELETPERPKPAHLDVYCDGDVLVSTIRGPYDAEVAWYLEALYVQLADRYGYRLALIHARETTTVTPEARRLLAQWNNARKDPAAGAIVGASFAARTAANLVTRAVELITKTPSPIGFFDSEAGARVWLDAQREVLQKAAAKRIVVHV